MIIDKLVSVKNLYDCDYGKYEIDIVLKHTGSIYLSLSQKQLDNLRKNFYSKHITYIVFDETNKRFIWSSIDSYKFLEASFNGKIILEKSDEDFEIDKHKDLKLSTKTKPLKFQEVIAKIAITNPSHQFAFFMEQGLGKTKTSLDAAVYLLKNKQIDKVLIYAPASLCTNWLHEIETHVYKTYHKKLFVESNSKLSLINSKRALKEKPLFLKFLNEIQNGRCLLIFDECHGFKNPNSNRTKFLIENRTEKMKCFLLSGTPAPKGFVDLYTYLNMFNLIQMNYYQFQNHFFKIEKTKFGIKILDEYTQLTSELLDKFNERAVWVKKNDVLDLPEKNYIQYYYALNPSQEKLIKAFLQDELIEHPEKENLVKFLQQKKDRKESAASFGFSEKDLNEVFSRMLQIQNGFYLDKEKNKIEIKDNNKLNLLFEIIESIDDNEPIIIFCSFTFEAEAIQEHLLKKGYGVIIRHGKLTKTKKNLSIKEFKERKNRILVATTASTGTGFTLIESNNIIYYSNQFGCTLRLQSEDRIHRIGQTRTCNYYDLLCEKSIDEIIYLFNKKNEKIQNKLYEDGKRESIKK